MQVAADGIEYDVDSRLCSDPKPSMVEACNNLPCPAEWVAQPFGQVKIRTECQQRHYHLLIDAYLTINPLARMGSESTDLEAV